eukprot:PhF_6_TR25745/c0_g1_i1/m.36288
MSKPNASSSKSMLYIMIFFNITLLIFMWNVVSRPTQQQHSIETIKASPSSGSEKPQATATHPEMPNVAHLDSQAVSDKIIVTVHNYDVTQRNQDRRVQALIDIWSNPKIYKEKYRYELFQPDFNCPSLERIGSLGDGGKWMCGVNILLQHKDCIVYSFGSNGNRVFEKAVLEMTPYCVIYTFDPNHEYGKLYTDPRNTFEPLWLQQRPWKQPELYEGGKVARVTTLPAIMKKLGHKRIDVLKLDVEGAEYDVLKIFKHQPKEEPLAIQIQLETHFSETDKGHCWDLVKLARFHAHLSEAGYLLFYKEPNPAYPHAAVEWSFIHQSALRMPSQTTSPWRLWTSVYNQTKSAFFCASVWSRTRGCGVGDFYDAYYQHPDKETEW